MDKMLRKIEEVFKYGQMAVDMMVSGETTWPTDKVDLFMLKVMFTKESGQTIKLMVSEFTLTIMEADTKVNGTKISNMVKVLNNGQMVQSMKVTTNKV